MIEWLTDKIEGEKEKKIACDEFHLPVSAVKHEYAQRILIQVLEKLKEYNAG